MRRRLITLFAWLPWTMLAAGSVLAIAPFAAMAQASPAAMATQTSNDRGVALKVTPKSTGPGSRRWEFHIVLDTHSADLSDDLMQSAILVTGDGRILRPVSWTGAGPGGHHRQGVLAFDVQAPPSSSLELRLLRPGESAPRVFRWTP